MASKEIERKKRRTKRIKNSRSTCYFCQKHLTYEEKTIEHLYPRSLGGGNHLANLTVACTDCNGEKGNMTLHEYHLYKNYLEYLADLSDSDLCGLYKLYETRLNGTKRPKKADRLAFGRYLKAIRTVQKKRAI